MRIYSFDKRRIRNRAGQEPDSPKGNYGVGVAGLVGVVPDGLTEGI